VRGDVHYLAPEIFEGLSATEESDVYSFGLILWEVIVGHPEWSPKLRPLEVMSRAIMGTRPHISPGMVPAIAELICGCCSLNMDERPSFDEILKILKDMKFKIMPDVKATKVEKFVSEIESWENKRSVFLDGL
jgi:serine/threonine-protein kinase